MKRKIAAVCLAAAVLGMFSGCSQSVSGESHETVSEAVQEETNEGNGQVTDKEGDLAAEELGGSEALAAGSRIAVVAKSVKDDYWKEVRAGMKDAVAQINEVYGYTDADKIVLTFEGPDSEMGVDDQINTVDAVLSENPAVLCLSAIDANSCEAQVETAHENGIPVVTFDSGLHSGQADAVCSSDNGKIGWTAAVKLAEALGNQGQVAVIAHSETGQSALRRVEAFQKTMDQMPGISVLETVYDGSETDLTEAVHGLLDSNPDLAGIFCTNGTTADVVLDCVKSSKRSDLAIVGVDGTQAQQEAVRSGLEVGFVAQNPYEIGYQTVIQAVEAAVSGDITGSGETTWVKSQWIDAANMDSFADGEYFM